MAGKDNRIRILQSYYSTSEHYCVTKIVFSRERIPFIDKNKPFFFNEIYFRKDKENTLFLEFFFRDFNSLKFVSQLLI